MDAYFGHESDGWYLYVNGIKLNRPAAFCQKAKKNPLQDGDLIATL